MSYLLDKFKMKGKVMEICDRYARNVLASLATVAHTGNYNDLSNKPTIPSLDNYYNKDEVDDIVDDINQLPSSSSASPGDVLTHTISGDGWYPPIKELPVITSGDNGKVLEVNNGSPAWVEPQVFSQEQSNWTETDTTSVSYIKNKPSLATVATSGSYNDLSNKPTIPTVNNGTLTIQKNGSSVATFTANQSGNATANITCEDKIARTTTNNWSYYKDSSGVYHITGHISFSSAMTSSLGNGFYRSSVYYWSFPVTLTAVSSITATLQDGSGLSGATIHSYSTSQVGFWIWTLNSGTRNVTLHIHISST